jgi:hypothetical protein
MAVTMKISVFSDVTSLTIVNIYWIPPPSGYKTWESEVICKKLREVTCRKNATVTFVVTAERPEFAVYHLVINNENSFESLHIVWF